MDPATPLDTSSAEIAPTTKAISCVAERGEPGRLSILIPCYNEEEFLATLLERVLMAPLPAGMERELIVVDDGSKDGSQEIARALAARYPDSIRVVFHSRNRGKGAAIRTAIEHASGEFCIIQDADLELDPREYERLLKPLLEGAADAVYGSRFMLAGERRVPHFWHSTGNWFLTTFCNVLADIHLTDMETCYKAFRTSLVRSIPIRSDRFGIEPELTIKLAQRRARIYETPISYSARTYDEGKKIGFSDALEAIYVMLKTRLAKDIFKDPRREMLETLLSAPNVNRWVAERIRPYVGREVLELNAGPGSLASLLARGSQRYVVCDHDEEHVTRLRTRFQHRRNMDVRFAELDDPESFRALPGQLETVVCIHQLEKVENTRIALSNVHAILQAGGRAIILVAHGPQLLGTLDAALGRCRRYSEMQLREEMEHAGFMVEHILPFNRVSRPAWYLCGKLLKKRALSRRQIRLFDRFVWLWRRLDSILPWPGNSLICIAAKK